MHVNPIILVTVLGSFGALASALIQRREYTPCPDTLFGNPACCAEVLENIAGFNCSAPTETPESKPDFEDHCAEQNTFAVCCLLPAVSSIHGTERIVRRQTGVSNMSLKYSLKMKNWLVQTLCEVRVRSVVESYGAFEQSFFRI